MTSPDNHAIHIPPAWRMIYPAAWAGLVSLLLFVLFYNHGFDDPYITYRYAANLAAGAGFVYNPGLHVLSTTTPLYAMILALPAGLGLDLPLVSNAIGCVSMAAGGLALWRIGRRAGTPLAGMVALLLYPLSPQLSVTLGAETTLSIALILWGFALWLEERYRPAALLLALATLTRADGLVAAGAVALYTLVERLAGAENSASSTLRSPRSIVDRLSLPSFWRGLPWGALMLYCVVLMPWLVFAWRYFGSPLPATLAAKQLQGELAVSRDFLEGLALAAQDHWAALRFHPLIGCAALGLVYVLLRPGAWWLPLGWNLLYSAGYTLLGVSAYFWYYGPLVAGFVILGGLGVEAIERFVRVRAWAGAAIAASGLLIAILVGLQGLSLVMQREFRDPRLPVYREIGDWLRERTPPDAAVGTLEVGIIGYYSERPMIDFAGLIQPDVARRLGPAASFADAARYAIERYRPPYLALHAGLLAMEETARSLGGRCEQQASFGEGRLPAPIVMFKCEW